MRVQIEGFGGAGCGSRTSLIEPIFDHEMRERLCPFAAAAHYFSGHFHVIGMNGHEPFAAFDPSADRVPNAFVFH
jgi:hypothetical protein